MQIKAHYPGCLVAALVLLSARQPACAGPILPSVAARVTEEATLRPESLPSDEQLVAEGMRIGAVLIEPRNVFDTSRPEDDAGLFRLADRLHYTTRADTIGSQLLFQSGEPYDPRLLQETARHLRSARYLRDASIQPVAAHDGVVDLKVATQDVWTLNPGISFGRSGGRNTWNAQLEELNLLGRGSQLSLQWDSGIDRSVRSLSFRDAQLGGSWWRLGALLADNSDGHRVELDLTQPFHALDARRAGGVQLLDDSRVESRYDLGEVIGSYRQQQRQYSAWAGRSSGLHDGSVLRWTAGYTWDERRFQAADTLLPASQVPADRRLAYPWIGVEYLQDRFATTRNRDQIGRTEDRLLGWQASARLGYVASVFGADRSALMFTAGAQRGWRLAARHWLDFGADLAGRIEDGAAAGTIASWRLRYYYQHSPHWSTFASLSTDAGFGLDEDQQMLLGGDNGLRGYPLRYQAGKGRWLATLEQRLFTDWYPFRMFNVGAAVFFDAGGTWGTDRFASPPLGTLKDAGIGLRLGNSRSALGDIIHVDLAWPLDGPATRHGLQLVIETKHSF